MVFGGSLLKKRPMKGTLFSDEIKEEEGCQSAVAAEMLRFALVRLKQIQISPKRTVR
jgi:hypothetical protein